MVKVLKAFGHRHGRRSEDGRVHFGQPLVRQGLADIDALGGHRLPARTQPTVNLQRVHIVLVRTLNDELGILGQLVQTARNVA